MATQLKLERIGEVPPDADVCDYDELDDPVKHRFAEAVGSTSAGRGEDPSVSALEGIDCDVVRFTEYYHLDGL